MSIFSSSHAVWITRCRVKSLQFALKITDLKLDHTCDHIKLYVNTMAELKQIHSWISSCHSIWKCNLNSAFEQNFLFRDKFDVGTNCMTKMKINQFNQCLVTLVGWACMWRSVAHYIRLKYDERLLIIIVWIHVWKMNELLWGSRHWKKSHSAWETT